MVPAAVLALIHEVLCVSSWLSSAPFPILLLAYSLCQSTMQTFAELMGTDFLWYGDSWECRLLCGGIALRTPSNNHTYRDQMRVSHLNNKGNFWVQQIGLRLIPCHSLFQSYSMHFIERKRWGRICRSRFSGCQWAWCVAAKTCQDRETTQPIK